MQLPQPKPTLATPHINQLTKLTPSTPLGMIWIPWSFCICLLLSLLTKLYLPNKKRKSKKSIDMDELSNTLVIVSTKRKTRSLARQSTLSQTIKVRTFSLVSCLSDVINIYSLIFLLQKGKKFHLFPNRNEERWSLLMMKKLRLEVFL